MTINLEEALEREYEPTAKNASAILILPECMVGKRVRLQLVEEDGD